MPPKSLEEDDEKADETSALLLLQPSPGSTNRPSLTNLMEYGSLIPPTTEENADASIIQMHAAAAAREEDRSIGDDAWPMKLERRSAGHQKRSLVNLFLAGVAFLLLVAVGKVYLNKESNTVIHQEKKEATSPPRPTSTSTNNIHQQHGHISRILPPLSSKHPVADLKVKSFQRPDFSAPNPELFSPSRSALPTNSWYQNLLLARHEPTQEQRVYPVPYVIDVVGPIPGIRVHPPSLIASATVLQLTQVLEHGLTLGAASRQTILGKEEDELLSKKYKIAKMNKLGITLEWTDPSDAAIQTPPLTYSSSIVRGMPYATMQYNSNQQAVSSSNEEEALLPTIASETPIGALPVLDGGTKLKCGEQPQWVQKDIQLEFSEPDYTWLVFVSRPVRVKCIVPPPPKNPPVFVPGRPVPSPGIVFALQFFDTDDSGDSPQPSSDLVIRVALANECTHGANPMTCGHTSSSTQDPVAYASLLRRHADLYPGSDTDVTFDFAEGTNDTPGSTRMNFNWNVQSMKQGQIKEDAIGTDDERSLENGGKQEEAAKLLMYALPHHQDMIEESNLQNITVLPTYGANTKFCKDSLLGAVCIVEGSTWHLQEEQMLASFRAPRPPQNDILPDLVKAYHQDLNFELPSYFQRGAGDTYFSGKMLAKLARILTIGEELHEICSNNDVKSIPKECNGLEIPAPDDSVFLAAVTRLRSSVEVWINGTADTPFVYDDEWGGMVTCGCEFDSDQGACRNQYPNCPAFYDPGLDFGLSFYNDHHFHLGYHIYAAAAVAHFDPQWGRDRFEQVLLLVRDIANPSHDDAFFPTFRNKDWYQGSSWASGIAVSPLNGRNQESSSEAIAAYEGVAMFGMEMVKAWEAHSVGNAIVAKEIQNYGNILMASEVRSADRYYHVYEGGKESQYPVQYTPHVVGIMWNTMAQFQTWFGSAAYLAYGIQLLPLTAASEKRDKAEWSRELYEPFKASCDAHFQDCREQGWSVLVLAILATVGHRNDAIQKALELPLDAFETAGGNGHSLTNTLWYLATRPHVDDPLVIDSDEVDETSELEEHMHPQSDNPDNDINGEPSKPPPPPAVVNPDFNCSCPKSCDTTALSQFADGHSCGDRIAWLMSERDHIEWDACHQVALEFPGQCSACDPLVCSVTEEEVHSNACPPCSREVCKGKLNRCPIQSAPFLCTEGAGMGGCSPSPWTVVDGVCGDCCELSLGCED